jgi:uncharacterized protein HemY
LTGCATTKRLAFQQSPLSPAEHVTLGDTYRDQNQEDLAARQYQAALRQDRKSVPALMNLGNMAYDQQKWKDARSYFQRALKVKPGDAAALNNLAMVNLAEGKSLEKSAGQLEKALPHAGTVRPYLLDTLGQIALHRQEWEKAEDYFARARGEAPAGDPNFLKKLEVSIEKLAQARTR